MSPILKRLKTLRKRWRLTFLHLLPGLYFYSECLQVTRTFVNFLCKNIANFESI